MTPGTRVKLRTWCARDLEAVLRLRNDPSLRRLLMASPRPQNRDEVLAWLEAKDQQEDFEFLVVALKRDDSVVGYVQAAALDRHNGTADFGICLAAEAQGLGLGSEACEMFHAHLRKQFGLRKLLLRVLADNSRAISLYNRLGYREVGTLLRHYLDSGAYHDVLVMELFLRP